DADVVRTATKAIIIAARAAMTSTLRAVRHPERRAVVAGAEHPALAGDHGTNAASQAVGAGARGQGDQQEVLALVRPWWRRRCVGGVTHRLYGGGATASTASTWRPG